MKEKAGEKTECGSAKSISDIRERMDVIASCGNKVRVADNVEGGAIKLTKNDSPDGQRLFIPAGWIERVDAHVHLKKNSEQTAQEWDAAACSSCGA